MKKFLVSLIVIVAFVEYTWYEHESVVATSSLSSVSPTPSILTPSPTSLAGQYTDGSYTGTVADAFYGPLQVQAIVQGGQLTDVQFLQSPNGSDHSVQVNKTALPKLKTEAIVAQSADVHTISGATQTSEAFQESLAAALSQAQ